jgi:hypothetical protein
MSSLMQSIECESVADGRRKRRPWHVMLRVSQFIDGLIAGNVEVTWAQIC